VKATPTPTLIQIWKAIPCKEEIANISSMETIKLSLLG